MLGLGPKSRLAHTLEPIFELGTVALQWFRQWPARIFAHRVGHAFPEPIRFEEPIAEAAKVLALQMMNELMPHKVWLPATMAYDNGKRSNVVCDPRRGA